MAERKFRVTKFVQYLIKHDPFNDTVPIIKLDKIYLWFEPNSYEKLKFNSENQSNTYYKNKPIALTLVYFDREEINAPKTKNKTKKSEPGYKTVVRHSFAYHEKLLNTFNDQQLVISVDETKNRKIPENLNPGELHTVQLFLAETLFLT